MSEVIPIRAIRSRRQRTGGKPDNAENRHKEYCESLHGRHLLFPSVDVRGTADRQLRCGATG